MAKVQREIILNVPDGIYLITQDLLSSSHFRREDLTRMVAMGIESQVGNTLVAVVGGRFQVIDGTLPESLVRLVLDANQDRGFTCLEPSTGLVSKYCFVPVCEAQFD